MNTDNAIEVLLGAVTAAALVAGFLSARVHLLLDKVHDRQAELWSVLDDRSGENPVRHVGTHDLEELTWPIVKNLRFDQVMRNTMFGLLVVLVLTMAVGGYTVAIEPEKLMGVLFSFLLAAVVVGLSIFDCRRVVESLHEERFRAINTYGAAIQHGLNDDQSLVKIVKGRWEWRKYQKACRQGDEALAALRKTQRERKDRKLSKFRHRRDKALERLANRKARFTAAGRDDDFQEKMSNLKAKWGEREATLTREYDYSVDVNAPWARFERLLLGEPVNPSVKGENFQAFYYRGNTLESCSLNDSLYWMNLAYAAAVLADRYSSLSHARVVSITSAMLAMEFNSRGDQMSVPDLDFHTVEIFERVAHRSQGIVKRYHDLAPRVDTLGAVEIADLLYAAQFIAAVPSAWRSALVNAPSDVDIADDLLRIDTLTSADSAKSSTPAGPVRASLAVASLVALADPGRVRGLAAAVDRLNGLPNQFLDPVDSELAIGARTVLLAQAPAGRFDGLALDRRSEQPPHDWNRGLRIDWGYPNVAAIRHSELRMYLEPALDRHELSQIEAVNGVAVSGTMKVQEVYLAGQALSNILNCFLYHRLATEVALSVGVEPPAGTLGFRLAQFRDNDPFKRMLEETATKFAAAAPQRPAVSQPTP